MTVKLDYLETECKRAQASPGYQNTFRRLHLNQWTQQETPLAADGEVGRVPGGGGCDFVEGCGLLRRAGPGQHDRYCRFCAVLSDRKMGRQRLYAWLPFFWIPDREYDRAGTEGPSALRRWVRQGLITATEGNVIDYAFIVKKIEELGEAFQIKEIAFDRWGAFQVSQQLEGAGFTMVGFGQGFQSMSCADEGAAEAGAGW